MNDLLVSLGNGINRYEHMTDDNKAITEITFDSVTAILSADISATYTDTDIEALRQNGEKFKTVSEAVSDKVEFIAFAHHFDVLNKTGKVKLADGKEIKSLQELAKWAGVKKSPKQRGSDFKAILECPIDLAEFKECRIGKLKAIADAIKKGVSPDDITPDTTLDELKALINKANSIPTDSTEKPTDTTEKPTEGTESTEDTEDTEKPTEPIHYDEKSKSWYFRNCTTTQLLAWVHEHISTLDKEKEYIIKGAMSITEK